MLNSGKAYLVVDGGALCVGVGVLRDSAWLAEREMQGEALQTIFNGTREVLEEAGLSHTEIGGFIFNSGPGSVLGIRLACMALTGWLSLNEHQSAELYAYRSLDLAAVHLISSGENSPFVVAADYREGRFISTIVMNGSLTQPQLLDADEVQALNAPIYRLPQRKVWKSNTSIGEVMPYPFNELPKLTSTTGFIHAVEKPEPFTFENPDYVKWDAQRHR